MKYTGLLTDIVFLLILLLVLSIFCVRPCPLKAAANSENIEEQYSPLQADNYLKNFLDIPLRAVSGEVFTRDETRVRRNAIFALSLGGAFLLDQSVRDFAQDNLYAGDNLLASFLYNIGTPGYAVPIYGLGLGWSHLNDDIYLRDTLLLSLQSLLVTQGFTSLVKNTVRRARPRQSPDDPFRRIEGGRAFFSGHSSGSWAAATVIAERYPRLRRVFYGLAAAVATARIYEDAHWLSDVLAGSAVGYGIARLTLQLNEGNERGLTLLPGLGKQSVSLSAGYSF